MKKILCLIICLSFILPVMAADKVITITIPEAKVAIALQGFLSIYPNNETIDDPEWVDPEDGLTPDQIAKYTDSAWVTEKVRRIIVRDIRRGLQEIANKEVIVPLDDSIAQ